jgi:hypothetical protein
MNKLIFFFYSNKMSIVSGNLLQNKLAGVDSIANFSQAARTFAPTMNNCFPANAVDQYGRPAGYGSLYTFKAGCNSIQETILNENSLRPPLSSNPQYKNIQSGIGGNGADTLFGLGLPGRGYAYAQTYNLNMPNAASCMTTDPNAYQFSPAQMKYSGPCALQNELMIPAKGGNRTSDMIKTQMNFF